MLIIMRQVGPDRLRLQSLSNREKRVCDYVEPTVITKKMNDEREHK